MQTEKDRPKQIFKTVRADFFNRIFEESWAYIKTVVDVVREPILILDKDLRVMAANDPFCQTFQVESKDTEGRIIYKLGNGQWNIPSLRNLLEDILPHNTFFKGFEVDHNFPIIGRKIMMLNAREIYFTDKSFSELFPPIILLAMEDVTEMIIVAENLTTHATQLETIFTERIKKLDKYIVELEAKLINYKSDNPDKK